MRRISPLMLAIGAMFALSAVAATAAQAVEGPFWQIGGTRLASGETRSVIAKAEKPFILKNNVSKVKVECKEAEFKSGATINGSSGTNAGGGLGSTVFSECEGGAKEEGLTGCKPEGGTVTTLPITTTLGYATSTRTGPLLVLLSPASGTTFTTIKFTGTCFAASTSVTGSVVGEVLSSAKAIEVGGEKEAAKLLISFGETVKTIFVESNGGLKSAKTSLVAFGTAATLTGVIEVELSSKANFGIFT